MSQLNRH